MKEKLILSIDKETIEKANHYARKRGMSISKMVETYLETLPAEETDFLYQFGKRPVDTGIADGSENHNRYIYSSKK